MAYFIGIGERQVKVEDDGFIHLADRRRLTEKEYRENLEKKPEPPKEPEALKPPDQPKPEPPKEVEELKWSQLISKYSHFWKPGMKRDELLQKIKEEEHGNPDSPDSL